MSHARLLTLVLLLTACAFAACALAGCGAQGSATGAVSPPVASATCSGDACELGAGTQSASIFVEPDAKASPLLQAIGHATISVWVETYLLTNDDVIRALESAANRGVDVRVLLELAPYGAGSVSPQLTLERLQAAGVKAQGANPAFQYTHAKMLVVDRSTAFIMTCNLTLSGLGGSRSATNRDFGIIDSDPADVAESEAIFQADWSRTAVRQTDPNLVVSPIDARTKLDALLDAAHTQLYLEDEELVDQQVEQRLIAAAKRGVDVRLVLPAPSDSSPSADLSSLLSAGVKVRYSASLYMHAKMIVADGTHGFVGSENFSATSLDENREVGVLLANPSVLATLANTFLLDWATGTAA